MKYSFCLINESGDINYVHYMHSLYCARINFKPKLKQANATNYYENDGPEKNKRESGFLANCDWLRFISLLSPYLGHCLWYDIMIYIP